MNSLFRSRSQYCISRPDITPRLSSVLLPRLAIGFLAVLFPLFSSSVSTLAQNLGTSGTIQGTVLDPSGAAIKGATIEIHNPVSGYTRSALADESGSFVFPNIPFNPYHLIITATGFQSFERDVNVRASVPVDLKVTLQIATSTTVVTVKGEPADLIEAVPTNHTDVDRSLFDKLPLESQSSSVSSLITLSTPGIAADSNGLFHGMGDHAENSFSVDGQPITDQQSKVFSNQIPLDSIQSLEVIPGAPPAEYGDKTSVVINVTTRSGQGVRPPHGSMTASYGTFGSSLADFQLGYGGQKWGNFIGVNGLNTSRFLDPPEVTVMHDKGNEENVFDRVDFQPTSADSLQLNFNYTRSWFQNPNTYDQQLHVGIPNPVTGGLLGPTDERSQIRTFNIAPSWTRLVNSATVLTFGGFVRQDRYNYYPSADPFADYSPDLLSETVLQDRKLTNAGVRGLVSYAKGIHSVKAGAVYQQTFLTENDSLGIVDPTLVPGLGCLNGPDNPVQGTPCAILAPYDLTEGGSLFSFNGHTDVKELSLYGEDAITKGNWNFNLGIRGDLYNGLSIARLAEPRLGIAYKINPSSTVLRVSYARVMETPFNENLVIASTGCSIPFLATLVPPPGVTCKSGPIQPGRRNEFHAGLEQAFGRYAVVDGEYIWKYTHNAYDFGVVGATPIYFPIQWTKSKIPGFALRVSVPDYHGFSAQVVMSSVAARFFLPQEAGIPIIPAATAVFRIDHDEFYNQTTHLQYQPWKRGPWIGFNWRYDSGLVSGAVPCVAPTATCTPSTPIALGGTANVPSNQVAMVNAITGLPLTADQEFQAGFTCGGKLAAPSPIGPPLPACNAADFGSLYIRVPKPGTENDDHNPQRIAPRHLFDLAVGEDNLFHGDRYKWSLRFTVINLADKVALYNFFSTFSGTHYVTPRTLTAEIGFHF